VLGGSAEPAVIGIFGYMLATVAAVYLAHTIKCTTSDGIRNKCEGPDLS
jgi:hypothetical protein